MNPLLLWGSPMLWQLVIFYEYKWGIEGKKMKWERLIKITKKTFINWLVAGICVLGIWNNKVYGAIYVHKSFNFLEGYISYLEKHYKNVISIQGDDVNLPLIKKRVETIINSLSEDEKKFLGILLVYPDQVKKYHLSFRAKNLANKLIVSKLYPNKVQLSEKEKQQIQKYSSKIQENIDVNQLREKLTILFTLQYIKQQLEKDYFDVQYKKTKLGYIVKNLNPKIQNDFLIEIKLPIKLASKESIVNTEINKNLLLLIDRSFWNRLNPNIHIYSNWTIIIITNPKKNNKLAQLTWNYLEQQTKHLEQQTKFIKEELNKFFNRADLSPIWQNIEKYKRQWDIRYNIVKNNPDKLKKMIKILKERELLDIMIDNLKGFATLAIDKIRLESPQDAKEYEKKILEICKIILEASWKPNDCKLNTNINKNADTARNFK